MIELAHVGSGAVAGAGFRAPLHAAIAGVIVHGLLDAAPHGEMEDEQWELASTALGLGLLLARFGARSPVFWGAVGSVLPDVEIVVPAPRPGGRRLFPTHRYDVLHSSRTPLGLPAWAQAVLGGAAVGALFLAGNRGTAPTVARRRSAVGASLRLAQILFPRRRNAAFGPPPT